MLRRRSRAFFRSGLGFTFAQLKISNSFKEGVSYEKEHMFLYEVEECARIKENTCSAEWDITIYLKG